VSKDVILEYIQILEEYSDILDKKLTDRQRYVISLINEEAFKNDEFRIFIENLKDSNDKEKMIEEYFNNIEKLKSNNEEEVIANTFGIDIKNVEHKYLDNGKELFCFYDDKLGRNVYLENGKNGVSLVSQLKEIQISNTNYQTDNNEKNVQNILEDKRFKENCELYMIPLSEIENHINRISGLSVEDYKKLSYLIKNSEMLGLSAINIENVLGFDKEGKLFEVHKDELTGEYTIVNPNSANYNVENINTSENLNFSQTYNEQVDAISNKYEDNPNEVVGNLEKEVSKFYELPPEIQERTKFLYEYPDLLEDLSTEEREIWKQYVDMYKKVLELEEIEKQKKQNAPKVRKYVLDKEDNYGYINLSTLSIIIGFVILTLFSVIMICC